MSRLVSRDPFAREELHSKRVYVSGETCAFCGQTSETFRGKRFLMSYYMESDGGRKNYIRGRFCSISCMRAYHG